MGETSVGEIVAASSIQPQANKRYTKEGSVGSSSRLDTGMRN